MDILGQADPTGTQDRHPEWPIQLLAAEDTAEALCDALMSLESALCAHEAQGPLMRLTVEEAQFLLKANAHSDGIHQSLQESSGDEYMTKSELVRRNRKAISIQEKLRSFISDNEDE